MKVKKIKVIVDGEYDYKIEKSKNKAGDRVYTLSYSKNDKIWTQLVCGKKILTCTDDSAEFVLKFKFNETFDFGHLEHDESFYIHVMLNYIHRKGKAPKIKYKKNGTK